MPKTSSRTTRQAAGPTRGGTASRSRKARTTVTPVTNAESMAKQQDDNDVEVVRLGSFEETPNASGPGQCRNSVIDFQTLLEEQGILPVSQPAPPSSAAGNSNVLDHDIELLRCGGDGIGAHVPHQLCQKIWSNEYVNLAMLLKGGIELSKMFDGAGILQLNDRGEIVTKPAVSKDRISGIENWTNAFMIYMSIYLLKNPEKTQEMLQYMFLIREAAEKQSGMGWRLYDEQFRLRQSYSPQSWGKINGDLWLRVMAVPQQHASQHVPQPNRHICKQFNVGFCQYGANCKFQHRCSGCESNQHGAWTCSASKPVSKGLFRGNSTRGSGGFRRSFTRRRASFGNFHQ